MKHKQALSIYYQPEDGYVCDTMPGYLQKRFRYGQGFPEVLPPIIWPPRCWTELDKERYDELFVPLTPWEIRYLRTIGERRTWRYVPIEVVDVEKIERKRRRRMEEYLKRYLAVTGLAWQARKAGVGLRWLFKGL